MPITCPIALQPLDQQKFAKMDYRVMRCAFDTQNQLGRLCDEVIYQTDLAVRLQTIGLHPVRREVPVTVTYNTDEFESQLQALLDHSPLSILQWVNLARHRIQLIILRKNGG